MTSEKTFNPSSLLGRLLRKLSRKEDVSPVQMAATSQAKKETAGDKEAKPPSLYFAYGSNMSHAQMQTRCPGSVFVCAVRLEGYRFVYDGYEEYRKGAVANIVPDDNPDADQSEKGIVWGGLYKVTPENIANLDGIETGQMAYKRTGVSVQDATGKQYDEVGVYLRPPLPIDKPTDEYRNTILQGAKDCGLPQDYVEKNL